MPKTIHLTRSRWFWTLALASSLVLPARVLDAQTNTLNVKVKVVEVIKSGTTVTVNPVKVKLKRKEEIAVWVSNGLSLKIEFKKGNPAPGSPFTDLTCKGRFCAALTPPDVAPAVFQYKVTVDGVVLDPNVEVIP
jgi:hypothetical protein